MPAFTIHEPPPRQGDDTSDPARFAFVRDGFHVWAFLLGPLWMLRHRLWLALLVYAVTMAATLAALWALGVSVAATAAVGVLISLLVGFEAASMRRWTFARRRWNTLGLVVAPDRESAERRFFDSWIAGSPGTSSSVAGNSSAPEVSAPMRIPPPAPAVIGLFPEPDARR